MKEIDDIWEGDLLGRKEEAVFLQRYIENVFESVAKDTSFVLNINTEWGHGKTWFLERFSKQLRINYPTVYFDAWKNDFTKDALLSFVSVICDDLSQQFTKGPAANNLKKVKKCFENIVKKSIPIVAAFGTKQLVGMSLENLEARFEDLKDDTETVAEELAKVATSSMIDDFLEKRKGIESFKTALTKLVDQLYETRSLPICVIVDELDRCRPTYAIELLESIKHLFDVKGVIFILATDTKQLSHSIKAIYGNEFTSSAYLKRFFSAEYQLSEPNYKNLSDFLFSQFRLDDRIFVPSFSDRLTSAPQLFSLMCAYFKLTARDQFQIYDTLSTILLSSERQNFHFIFLLLLIILKHKFEVESTPFFNNIDTPPFSALLRSLHNSAHTEEQNIVGYYTDGIHGRSKPETLSNIFDFYVSLVDGNRDLDELLREDGGWQYQFDTARAIFHNNDLHRYRKIISQSGRIHFVK